MEGKICTVSSIIEGVRYDRRIALTKPETGGMNPLSDHKELMVYGTLIGSPGDNRWHYFPLRNVQNYNVAQE
jgi:hypothetical protein